MKYPAELNKGLTRYFGASLIGHLAWETLQLPLYSIWREGSSSQIALAVAHCAFGDMLIAAWTLVVSLILFRLEWPSGKSAFGKFTTVVIALGVSYTVYSEWLNVHVRVAWTYSAWMPLLPPLGTGLSPVMQWFVVPYSVLRLVSRGMKP